jgi:pimeloyl-ACP methyl ester carboxylesterase
MRMMFSRSGLEVNQQGAACLSKMHIRATLAASLKEERMSAPSILFLHGGPGMSPVFEKARFPEASDVHWWQQPVTVPCAVHPFQDLLAATLAEFRRCVEAHGAPMTILASSFGAHLAVHLSRQMPESIARIVLLGPTFDPEQAAMRLARRAFQLHMDDANAGKLAAALAAYEDDPGRARFWDVFGALSLLPDVPELYFSPNAGEAARSFVELIQQPGAFDGPTSVATSDDFAAINPKPLPSPYTGPVQLVFGKYDVMIDADKDAAAWRAIFPQASIHMVDSGHFPLQELPLEACLHPA